MGNDEKSGRLGSGLAGAEGRDRTGMTLVDQQFLRLSRLPIPPLRPWDSDLDERATERKTRFELATPSLARRCSTTELLPRDRATDRR